MDEIRGGVEEEYKLVFLFQAEDGIRDAQESRGLGDVYKRQPLHRCLPFVTGTC